MPIDWDKVVIGPVVAKFGEPVTYTPAGASAPVPAIGGGPIMGVYDEAYTDQNTIDGLVEANTTMPVLGVRLAQFALAPSQNDQLVIQRTGEQYIVKDVRADGHGWAKLLLQAM